MKVIGSQDLGGLGATSGTPAIIEWNLAWSFLRALPAVLVLGVLLLSPNRSRPAWWILLPWGSIGVFLGVLRGLSGSRWSSNLDPLMDIAGMLAAALAVIWLHSYVFQHFRPWRCMTTIVLLAVGVGVISTVAINGWDMAGKATAFQMLVIYLLLAVIALAALTGSGLRWRKRPRGGWGYGLRFLIWSVGAGMVLSLVFFGILVLAGEGPSDWWRFVPQLLLIGGILGTAAAGVTLPFVILCFSSAFWRARFQVVFPPMVLESAVAQGGDEAVIRTRGESEPTPAADTPKEAAE